MPAIQSIEGQTIAALMVRDRQRSERLAIEFRAGRAHTNAEELIQDPGIDAVYVSSPVNLHCEHVLAAAAARKHVLCEKPMAMSAAECQDMIDACTSASVTLGVCFVLRGWEIYQRIREMLQRGDLGTIVELRVHLAKWTPRELDEWRLDPEQSGGGTLVDVASHYLDLFRYLQGEIAKIAYMGSSTVFGWPVEETAHILVEFESGSHGTLTATCTVPVGGNVLEIYGSAGSLFLGRTLEIVRGDEVHEEDVTFPDYYSGLLQEFAACAGTDRDPIASGRDGLRGMEIVDGAYRSAEGGIIVTLGRDA